LVSKRYCEYTINRFHEEGIQSNIYKVSNKVGILLNNKGDSPKGVAAVSQTSYPFHFKNASDAKTNQDLSYTRLLTSLPFVCIT